MRLMVGNAYAVQSVAFSPDGKRLTSSGSDNIVKLWATASGQETLSLKTADTQSKRVAFSPDGQQLIAAGNWHGTIKLWDVRPLVPPANQLPVTVND